jgi:hypothetical protein
VKKLDEKLAALARDPDPATLRDALRSKTGVLVAAAANLVEQDLAAELAPAFARLVERAVERDPGCRGKLAVVRAMHRLDVWDDAVLAVGIRHLQPEPVWGGTEDTAGELRATCGLYWAQSGRADTLDVLAELLADPDRTARAGAARALGDTSRVEATALLRHKALIGDDEPAVLTACVGSLLALAPEASLPFVTRLLDGDPDRAEAAALALGESRLEAAFPVLRDWCEAAPPEVAARVGYLALALLRLEAATTYLVEVVRGEPVTRAAAAVRALATFKEDRGLAERVTAAVQERGEPAMTRELAKAFG